MIRRVVDFALENRLLVIAVTLVGAACEGDKLPEPEGEFREEV